MFFQIMAGDHSAYPHDPNDSRGNSGFVMIQTIGRQALAHEEVTKSLEKAKH